MSCVGERPWWPIPSLNKGRKKAGRLPEEGDLIEFIDSRFEAERLLGFGKG